MHNIYLLNDKMREHYNNTIREIKEEKRYSRQKTELKIRTYKETEREYQKRLSKRLKLFRKGKELPSELR